MRRQRTSVGLCGVKNEFNDHRITKLISEFPAMQQRLKFNKTISAIACGILVAGVFWVGFKQGPTSFSQLGTSNSDVDFCDDVVGEVAVSATPFDTAVELCNFQWQDGYGNTGYAGEFFQPGTGHYGNEPFHQKCLLGVNQATADCLDREPTWQNATQVPWENYAYGEYIGPHRTPHLPVYLIRVGDEISFNYLLSRTRSAAPYRIGVADILQISSAGDPTVNRENLQVLSDGTISLPLVGTVDAEGLTIAQLTERLNNLYVNMKLIRDPAITVQVVKGDNVINDIRDAVDARFGQGGQNIGVRVMPDGMLMLPLIGPVPAVGLTLDELAAEVNARYSKFVHGIFVTPNLSQSAPAAIFVLGEVGRSGRQELNGPITVLQALAAAEGYRNGANLRSVVVIRRDQDWKLVATKLDLSGAVFGRSPLPSDEIWLRNGDIVVVPPMPILRFSRAVELYLTRSVYSVFPQQQLVFNFDSFQRF